MAIKYLEILSTRRTRIGNLRFGVIYKLDDNDYRVADVIKGLTSKGIKGALKTPAAKLLTRGEAEKRAADVESLVPEDEKLSGIELALADKAMLELQNADLQQKFDQQGEDLTQATQKLGESENRAVLAEQAQAKASKALDDMKADLKSATAECARLKKAVKAQA